MELEIRYATTSDGVRIAYTVLGEGFPLVFMPGIYSDLRALPDLPGVTDFFEALGSGLKLVGYDGRGTGMSDRDVSDLSILGRARDLAAVIDAARLRSFALFGHDGLAPAAIVYACAHPGKVRKLILYGAYARSIHADSPGRTQRIIDFILADWHLGWRALVLASNPSAAPDLAEKVGHAYRTYASLDYTVRTLREHLAEVDVRHLLPGLRVPTLVLHRQDDRAVPFRCGRELAALLPNARLVPLKGDAHEPFFGEWSDVVEAVQDFLADDRQAKAPSVAARRGRAAGLQTILFTDIEGSTAMTQRLGDARAREVLREHERIVRAALAAHGGAEVKTMGDGFMASFGSATGALECAVAIQRAFAERNASLPAQTEALEARPERSRRGRAEPQPSAHASTGSARADTSVGAEAIRVRIGLNAGEPIAEDDPEGRGDLFGTAVNLAARIAAQAQGGEVLASDVVRQLVAGKGFLFADRGDVALRGFEDPVRLYEVRWREE